MKPKYEKAVKSPYETRGERDKKSKRKEVRDAEKERKRDRAPVLPG